LIRRKTPIDGPQNAKASYQGNLIFFFLFSPLTRDIRWISSSISTILGARIRSFLFKLILRTSVCFSLSESGSFQSPLLFLAADDYGNSPFTCHGSRNPLHFDGSGLRRSALSNKEYAYVPDYLNLFYFILTPDSWKEIAETPTAPGELPDPVTSITIGRAARIFFSFLPATST